MTSDIQLDTLEAKGLIRLATLRPELEYLFRHALVQDAAYGSLLKQERRDLHGRVGEALEELYPDRVGELAPVLAMHFEQAGQIGKAIDYFVAGGDHALANNALREAFVAYDRAAGLLDEGVAADDDDGPEAVALRRRRVDVKIGRTQAGYSFMPGEDSFSALESIVPEAERLADPALLTRLHVLIAMVRVQSGETPSAPLVKRSLERLSEIGKAIGDPSILAWPMAIVGMGQVFSGPVKDGVTALEEALPHIAANPDSIAASFARGALAIGYATLGEFDKAEAAVQSAIDIAARGDLIAQLDALIAESIVRAARGQLDRAVPLAQQCVDRAEETGASACIIASAWILGDAFHRQGRFEEARDVLQRGSDLSLIVDRRVWRPTLQAWLGATSAALGKVDDGDWDGSLATARSIGNQLGEAGILAKRGEAAAGRGDFDAAVADFAASAAILERLGARPALARLLQRWGETLRAGGRTADAEPILRKSLALFEEMGLDAEAAQVRTVLALGATKLAFD